MTGPIFQSGQLRAQYRAAKAKFDEAKAAYQSSVLKRRFQEVADALTHAAETSRGICVYDVAGVVALTESVDLATQRYLNRQVELL